MRRLTLAFVAAALLLSACGDPRERALAGFRAGMERASPDLYHALRDGLPDEYARLEGAAVDRLIAGVSTTENQRLATAEFAQIIANHTGDAVQAPSADIAATARTVLSLAQALQSADVNACAMVARGGAMPLNFPPGSPVQRAAVANNLANVRAIIAGRSAHITHAPISPAMLQTIIGDFRRRGGSEQWLREAGGGLRTTSPGEQCRNFILLQQIVLEHGDEVTTSLIVSGHQREAAQPPDHPVARPS